MMTEFLIPHGHCRLKLEESRDCKEKAGKNVLIEESAAILSGPHLIVANTTTTTLHYGTVVTAAG